MPGLIDRFLNTNSASPGPEGNPVSELLRQCKKSFVFVAVVTFFIEVLSLAPIIFMWNVFDRVVSSRSGITLVSLLVVVMLIISFWSALEWVRTRMMIRISLRIDWDIAARVFDTAFRRNVSRKAVDVHQAMGDVVNLRQFLTGAPFLALMSAPYAVLFIAVGYVFHPYLALFILIASLVQLLAAYSTSKVTTPALREANIAQAEAQRMAAQSLRQADSTLALGMLPAIRRRWFSKHQNFLGLQVNASESAGLMGGFTNFLNHALMPMQIALAAYLVILGEMTGGMMIAAMLLLRKAIQPIMQVMSSWPSIQSAKQSLERLNAMVAEDVLFEDHMKLPPPTGRLQVHDLVAQPPGARRPVLYNIKFELQPGQAMAVVGPSAAGKTSLLKLLVGLWYPNQGSVRLDGADVSSWIRTDLGPYIGYVPQDVEMFEGTVAENIARLGEVDPEKVVKATKKIGIHETILAFPQGYETVLGDTGHAITGGQKQRLAIARALYGDPVFLVMDEPNASVDDEGERILSEMIEQLKKENVTVVFSTHRPKLVSVADMALVLRDGTQVAFGHLKDVVGALKAASEKPKAPQIQEGGA
jgi:PrtD family type I secretion system ABC transporter